MGGSLVGGSCKVRRCLGTPAPKGGCKNLPPPVLRWIGLVRVDLDRLWPGR